MEYHCSCFSGLDREYSCTDRGGSTCKHRSSEERISISPILLTVYVVTIILAVLCWFVRFVTRVAITSQGRNCQLRGN